MVTRQKSRAGDDPMPTLNLSNVESNFRILHNSLLLEVKMPSLGGGKTRKFEARGRKDRLGEQKTRRCG